jgi:tRNA nucleotidyltransferase (CCA-adding enzyme)
VGEAWRAPGECRRHAELLPRVLAGAGGRDPAGWLALLEACDALRKPWRFLDLVDAAACVQDVDVDAWRQRVQAVRAIDAGAIARTAQGQPERIRRALGEARLAALAGLR